MDPGDKKALDDIEAYGCHVIHVLEEEDKPPFAYSVGIQRSSGAPEVIVIGLKQPMAHFVVNEYNRLVRKGARFVAGARSEEFLEGFSVQFGLVDKAYYEAYLGWNIWLYGGSSFETMQIVYPTTDGIWPWDSSASEWFRAWQPVLRDGGGLTNG